MRLLFLLFLCPLFFFSNAVNAVGHGCHSGHAHGSHSHGHAHASHSSHSVHISHHYNRSNKVRTGYRYPRPRNIRSPYDGRWNGLADKISVKITPTQLFDFRGGMLPIGLTYFLSANWSIGVSYYLPIKQIAIGGGNPGGEDYVQVRQDRAYSAEVRNYFASYNHSRVFTGLQGFYRNQVDDIDSGGYVQDGTMYSYGHATVAKESYGAAMLLGADLHLTSGLMLELYAGIGMRVHTTWQNDIVRLSNDGPDTCSCKTRPENNIAGTKAGLYVPVGMTLSWTFGGIPR